MEFCNYPLKMNVLRTDCCTFLKSENNQSISIRIKEKCNLSGYLKIQLSLSTHKNFRHFFKLFRLDEKNSKEVKGRVTQYRMNSTEDEIQLDFFGIRKLKRDQAIQFLREYFNDNENLEQIFKDNSSVLLLEIFLLNDDGHQIHSLEHEIRVGSPNNDKLEIDYYTPKTLCGDGEITIKLKKKIKDDNDNVQLEVIGLKHGCVKKLLQPSKDVLVYKVPLIRIIEDNFMARLLSGGNQSNLIEFFIRKSEPENLKRKSCGIEESCSDNKIVRISSNCTDSKQADISIKRQVNDSLIAKYLRKIARTGHDFAVGKELTEEMIVIITKLPVVCILQDDVGDTPLNNAILKNNEERADNLLEIIYKEFPEHINSFNSSGHTALILSPACEVSLEFIKKLIDYGSNLMAVDFDGNTAMNIAIQYRKTEVLNLLLNEALLQNFTLENKQLNSLLKDILDNQHFDGFQLLANHYPKLIEESNKFRVDENQLNLYKHFIGNFEILSEVEENCITPLAENDNEN